MAGSMKNFSFLFPRAKARPGLSMINWLSTTTEAHSLHHRGLHFGLEWFLSSLLHSMYSKRLVEGILISCLNIYITLSLLASGKLR